MEPDKVPVGAPHPGCSRMRIGLQHCTAVSQYVPDASAYVDRRRDFVAASASRAVLHLVIAVSQDLKMLKKAGIVQGKLTVHAPVTGCPVTSLHNSNRSFLGFPIHFQPVYRPSTIVNEEDMVVRSFQGKTVPMHTCINRYRRGL